MNSEWNTSDDYYDWLEKRTQRNTQFAKALIAVLGGILALTVVFVVVYA